MSYKSLIFVAFFYVFFGVSFEIFAQKEKYRIAVRSGFNLAHLEYLTPEKEQIVKDIRTLKPGVLFGISAVARLNPVLGVKAELIYTQKGMRTVQPVRIDRIRYNYVELPITGHITSSNLKKQFWDFFGGAYASYWTDGQYIVKFRETGLKTKTPIDFNNEFYSFNRADLGFLVGLSYYSASRTWCFDVRYAHGFASPGRKATDPTAHRVATIGAEYIFLKKGRL